MIRVKKHSAIAPILTSIFLGVSSSILFLIMSLSDELSGTTRISAAVLIGIIMGTTFAWSFWLIRNGTNAEGKTVVLPKWPSVSGYLILVTTFIVMTVYPDWNLPISLETVILLGIGFPVTMYSIMRDRDSFLPKTTVSPNNVSDKQE